MPVGDATSGTQGTGTATEGSEPTQPVESGQGTSAEGTGAPEGEAPETTPPAEGTGSEEGQTEEQAAAERTLATHEYTSSETSTTTTTHETTTTKTPEDRATLESFEQLLQQAEKGDKGAQQKLDQMSQVQLQEAETLEAEIRDQQDKYATEKEAESQKRLFDKAMSKALLLDQMAEKAKLQARTLPKDSPLRKALLQQAGDMKARAGKLRQQAKAFDARHQDAKAADQSKRYQQLLQQQQQGKKLTKAQQKQLANLAKKFGGEQKAGHMAKKGGGLYGKSQAKKPAAKAGQEVAKKAKEGQKPEQQAKKSEQAKAAKAPEVSDADVLRAQEAVAKQVDPQLREERLRKDREKREQIVALKTAFDKAKKVFTATGEAALQQGGEVLAGVREAGERVRYGYVQMLEDMSEGTNRFAGLRHINPEVAEAVDSAATEGLGTAVSGARSAIQRMTAGFSATREQVSERMARVLQNAKGSFVPTLETGPRARLARFTDRYRGWQPPGERDEIEVADFVTDNIGSKPA